MLKIRKEKEKEHQYIVSVFQVTRINRLFTELMDRELKSILSNAGTEVFFNLKDITFIDSEGFKVLSEANDYANSCHSNLFLCNIGEELDELFRLLAMKDKFRICEKEIEKEKILVEVEI